MTHLIMASLLRINDKNYRQYLCCSSEVSNLNAFFSSQGNPKLGADRWGIKGTIWSDDKLHVVSLWRSFLRRCSYWWVDGYRHPSPTQVVITQSIKAPNTKGRGRIYLPPCLSWNIHLLLPLGIRVPGFGVLSLDQKYSEFSGSPVGRQQTLGCLSNVSTWASCS